MQHILKATATSLTAAALVLGFPGGILAQPVDGTTRVAPVQKKKKKVVQKRAPTRLTVRPALRYRFDSTPFPRTDNLGFPGRNAVRQCVSWLAQEHRPSGTVLVPQMRCWWERG